MKTYQNLRNYIVELENNLSKSEKEIYSLKRNNQRMREALERIKEPIPIANNRPLKNRQEDSIGTVFENKPVSIRIAEDALKEVRE